MPNAGTIAVIMMNPARRTLVRYSWRATTQTLHQSITLTLLAAHHGHEDVLQWHRRHLERLNLHTTIQQPA